MGTRSTTTIKQDGKTILKFYRQFDGYPSGAGAELAKFLNSITIINGFSRGQRPVIPYVEHEYKDGEFVSTPRGAAESGYANGVGCLAAQLLTQMKTEAGLGGIYCISEYDGPQEYNYVVNVADDNGVEVSVADSEMRPLFYGSVADFTAFCEGYKEA